MAINKQNNRHKTTPKTHITFIMPRPKGISHCHRSVTGNNQLSSPVIPVPTPLNNSDIIPPHLSSVHQQSSSSSHNTNNELQASSKPGRTSPDPSNTVPPLSTKNGSLNIYGCMVDAYNFTTAQRQQHNLMLLQHYHDLCNTNDPSSIFVSPRNIPNI